VSHVRTVAKTRDRRNRLENRLQTAPSPVIDFEQSPNDVPKKSKSQTESAGGETVAPTTETINPAAKKRSSKKTSTARKSPAKKKPAPKAAKPKPAAGAAEPLELNEPSDADIRTRAYFIAERRAQLSLHGDPALDWIEARQQLVQEARQSRS
jgi:hypothetical protein